ncbi:MAG: hypothetical protein KJO23_09015 [Bacteroidia bacterium]|nr:hypothetical protein [Bacteroidia bacterium]NNM22890.1 hypothetical protein [Flavobacteriaceae bacterium]
MGGLWERHPLECRGSRAQLTSRLLQGYSGQPDLEANEVLLQGIALN